MITGSAITIPMLNDADDQHRERVSRMCVFELVPAEVREDRPFEELEDVERCRMKKRNADADDERYQRPR